MCKKHFSDLLEHILTSQLIDYGECDDDGNGSVAQVVQGSSMGLISSGEVSDKCFFEVVEKPFLVKQAVCVKFEQKKVTAVLKTIVC